VTHEVDPKRYRSCGHPFLQALCFTLKGALQMKHPYEKFMNIELVSILLSILVGVVAFIQGYLFLIFLALYLVVISLSCDALIKWYTHYKNEAIMQFVRSGMLFLLTTYLLLSL